MIINNELFWNSFDSIVRYRSSNLKINVIRPSTVLHVNNEYQFGSFAIIIQKRRNQTTKYLIL